jgi:hypothetical protein
MKPLLLAGLLIGWVRLYGWRGNGPPAWINANLGLISIDRYMYYTYINLFVGERATNELVLRNLVPIESNGQLVGVISSPPLNCQFGQLASYSPQST